MSNPIIKSQHLGLYENQPDGIRAIIAFGADATGASSITNKIGYWDASGTFQTIFVPAAGAKDPRGIDSRDYEFISDGVAGDLKKWKSALHYSLSSAADHIGANTTYTAPFPDTNLNTLVAGNSIIITGFVTSANNGTFTVGSVGVGSSSTTNTITVNNGAGVSETPAASATLTIKNVTEKWGIAAPTVAPVVGTPSGGAFITLNLSAVEANDGGVTTDYTGVGLDALKPGNNVAISGFGTSANNGSFTVQVSAENSATVVRVNNPAGAVETHAGILQTQNQIYPTTFLNGWGAFAHVGLFDAGGNNPPEQFITAADTVGAYSNPGNAFDGNITTYASDTGQHTAGFRGCVWSFPAQTGSFTNLSLNVLSEVPLNGTDGQIVNLRSASIYYTIDAGNNWTQVYDSNNRIKQWDNIPIPDGTALDKIQVMAFNRPHDDMYHKVYEINLTASLKGTGPITLVKGRNYFLVYGNTTSGHFSDISPASASTGALNGVVIPIQSLQISSDPQVDHKVLLSTLDGGNEQILFEVVDLPNSAASYQDSTPDLGLAVNQVYLSTDNEGIEHGVVGNEVPPNGSFQTKHRGRLFMLLGTFLYFSKSLADIVTSTGFLAGRYEEAWPPEFQMDISEGAEPGVGLFSDGSVLYIGTQRHIRRVLGDSTTTFTSPEIIFNEVGINNQDVWQAIFMEGTPAGVMWLTPDFRAIRSDFNTYNNVGEPIQTTLNSINAAVASTCWAQYVGEGAYNFYVLGIPTGANTLPDTLCVYNIKTDKWFVWKPADSIRSVLFYVNQAGIPRWLINANDGSIYLFDPAVSMDRSTGADKIGIASTIASSFLDMNDSSLRKVLNEVELATTQSSLLVTVEGASTAGEFASPNTVVAGASLGTNVFGDKKIALAGYPTLDRFYRLTVTDTSTINSTVNDEILSYYSFEVVPMHRS